MKRRRKVVNSSIDLNKKDTFATKNFFIVAIIILLVFGVFSYLFNSYENLFTIKYDGFFIKGESNLLDITEDTNEYREINTVPVKAFDVIQKTPFNSIYESTKKNRLNLTYPEFVNDGLGIVNYNDNINLINHRLERTTGFSNMIISYGKAFDVYGDFQIDKENYILLSYPNGIFVNLYDVKVKTINGEYDIPTNSFLYLAKDKIKCFIRDKDRFHNMTISDIDLSPNTKITFYYDEFEKYEYGYERFLEGIGTLYKVDKIPKVIEPIEEPVEEEIPPEEEDFDVDYEIDYEKPEFEYIKPVVESGELTASVYIIKGSITVEDPAGVIVKPPTYQLRVKGKTFTKKSVYGTGDFIIGGLMPSTKYDVIGQYTYLAEDMKTKVLVTFYTGTLETNDIGSLEKIEIDHEVNNIYPKKVEIENLQITSSLDSESIYGIFKVSIRINGIDYYLSPSNISALTKGKKVTVNTGNALDSNSMYDYVITFYDRSNNIIPAVNTSGKARTCKLEPYVNLSISSKNVDYVEIKVVEKNDDNVPLNNYRYEIYNALGNVAKRGDVSGETIMLRDLDPNQFYTMKVFADVDIEDGKGLKRDFELGSMDFTTVPLSSLGYLSVNVSIDELTSDSVTLGLIINQRKSDERLVRLTGKIVVNITDEDDKVVQTYTLTEEELETLKNEETIQVPFTRLESNKKYKIAMKSTSYQGNESYEADCIINTRVFETNKKPAQVIITNSYTSSKIIDFDVRIQDDDHSIISEFVRLEIKDTAGNIVKSMKLDINKEEPDRITINNLTENQTYYATFYVDEYNETNKNETYQRKYEIKKVEFFTDEGINGRIQLISSQRFATGDNLIDMKSNIKWIENGQSGTLHRTYDENGDMHIYSRKYAASYSYDLKEYTGKLVKVSFYAKAVRPFTYSLYFNNHITASTSTSYGYKLDLTNNFKYFEYTFMVGGYLYSNANTKTPDFQATPDLTYGRSIASTIGFYINGGQEAASEFVISKLQVKLYEEEEPEFDTEVAQGSWNGSNAANAQNELVYAKFKNLIQADENGWYKVEYNTMNNRYQSYFRIYDAAGKIVKSRGWNSTGAVMYLTKGQQIGVFFRKAQGNENPDLEEMKDMNFKVTKFKGELSSVYEDFTYNLITKVKVSVQDLRYEITNHDYYIKIKDKNGEILETLRYQELIDKTRIDDVIKELNLEEKQEYVIELGVMIRDRYYQLDFFEMSTIDEVGGIVDANEFRWIQPYGNYVVLNDIEFGKNTYCLGNELNKFNGLVDFQGYTMSVQTYEYSYMRKFCHIGNYGVLRNLVLDVHLNHDRDTMSLDGFIDYNNGLVQDIMVNVIDERPRFTKDNRLSPLMYSNNVSGVIDRFVINIPQELDLYDETGLLVLYNRGIVSNGYVAGHDINVPSRLNSNDSTRRISAVVMYGYVSSRIKNVFTLVNINFPNDDTYDRGGTVVYDMRGTVENAYTIGDTNPNKSTVGPLVGFVSESANIKNGYYYSQNTYTTKYHQKVSPVALNAIEFQEKILGSKNFIIEEMLEFGYYPQVRYASNKMPVQLYTKLPEYNVEQIDIIDMDILETTDDEATVQLVINNPYAEVIDKIGVSDVETEILDQSFTGGKSYVTVRLYEPKLFKSKYSLRTIRSIYDDKYISTRKYAEGEKYLFIDFYKFIRNYDDWIAMTKDPASNYSLKTDLDFYEYTNYYVGTFSGKFKGNNHTLKNIFINSNRMGLFNYMYGEMYDVKIVNFRKEGYASNYNGVFGTTNANTLLDNVQLYDTYIHIPEGRAGDVLVGSLVGYAPNALIVNCSSYDAVIHSEAETSNIEAGGLVGRLSTGRIFNSYVDNVDIKVENSIYSYGVGGIVGRMNYEQTIVQYSYATGNIDTNNVFAGGIVGHNVGYINNNWTTVNVSSELDTIGGIAGYTNKIDYVFNNLAAGSVFSNYDDFLISKSIPAVTFTELFPNYAFSEMQMNGVVNNRSYNGEILLSREQLMTKSTYLDYDIYDTNSINATLDTRDHILLTNQFNYDGVEEGMLPKLYFYETDELIPNQRDNYLYNDKFNILSATVDKHYDSADITVFFENPEHFRITDIKVDDMEVDNINSSEYNNQTIVSFNAVPKRHYDSYRLSKVTYLDQDGNTKTVSKKFKLDMQFFKEIWSERDWQNIDTKSAENYRLMADIDLSRVDKIQTEVMFNRLVTMNDNIYHTISNVDLSYNTDLTSRSFIKKVIKEMSNVKFDNIKIKDTSTKNNNYINIIGISNGNLKNLQFTNITFDTPNESYVAIVGRHLGRGIENIKLDNIKVKAKSYGSALVAHHVLSVGNRWITNVEATNLTIETSGDYAGGLFAVLGDSNSGANNHPNSYNSVKDSSITGVNYVGGIAGRYGDCDFCTVENVKVKGESFVGGLFGANQSYSYGSVVRNCKVSGHGAVGGAIGIAATTYDTYVFDTEVSADPGYAGGLFGSCTSSHTIARVGVHNTKISSTGSGVGLIGGYIYNTYVNYSYAHNSKAVGKNMVGGVAGHAIRPHVYYNIISDSTITANNAGAGGVYGYLNNTEYESGYFYSNLIENDIIHASSYAGGFYGLSGGQPLLNRTSIYSNYLSADIISDDEVRVGLISGDASGEEITNVRQNAYYEGTRINGTKIKQYVTTTPTEEKIVLNTFERGYINPSTGEIYENLSYYNAQYSEMVKLDKGKTYNIKAHNIRTNTITFFLVYYDSDGNFVGQTSSANPYIDRWVANSNSTDISFRVVKDCYIRFVLYYNDVIDRIEITSVTNDYMNISPKQLLDANSLRNRITWTESFNDKATATNMISNLSLSTSYIDFTPLKYEETGVTIRDLSGKGHNGIANVSSISKEGMYFDGVDDFIDVQNFKGSKDFTIIVKYMHTNTNGGYLFQYGPVGSTSNGYGLYNGTYEPYINLNNNNTAMSVPQYVLTDGTVAMTYDSSTKYATSFYNGEKIKETYINRIPNLSDDYGAYIGKSRSNGTFFQGVISSVMVFNRPLSESEINAIYTSSGVPNSSGLELYYDLTNYNRTVETAHYPILKWSNTTYNYPYQELVELPTIDLSGFGSTLFLGNLGKSSITTSTISGKYHIYPSGVDTINIEFDELPIDLKFSYKNGDYEQKFVSVNKRVYSLRYDYENPIEFNIVTTRDDIKEKLEPSDLSRTIRSDKGNYYYIIGNKLYKNGKELSKDALNIYNDLVLLKNNKIYNLETNKVQNAISVNGILSKEIPLYESLMDESVVSTYYNFSLVKTKDDATIREVQLVTDKDNNVYIFDNDGMNDRILFNKYNTNEYQVILSKDNKISSLKTDLVLNDVFYNDEIVDITFDKNDNKPEIMIRYKDDDVIVFNYVTGKVVFESRETKTTLFSYISKRVMGSGSADSKLNKSYQENNNMVDVILKVDNDELREKLGLSNNKETVNYSNKYVIYYNEGKGEYETVDVEKLLDAKSKETESLSQNDKIKKDAVLYNYFYGVRDINNVKSNRKYIYMFIIFIIVVNLFGLMIRGRKKHEKEKEAK